MTAYSENDNETILATTTTTCSGNRYIYNINILLRGECDRHPCVRTSSYCYYADMPNLNGKFIKLGVELVTILENVYNNGPAVDDNDVNHCTYGTIILPIHLGNLTSFKRNITVVEHRCGSNTIERHSVVNIPSL